MSKESKSTSRAAILAKLRQVANLVQECIEEVGAHESVKGGRAQRRATQTPATSKLDFDTNERNFVRTHGTSLTRAGKFTLLLAYLVKGELNKEVQLNAIEGMWGRMTVLLGGKFNRNYSNGAKGKGWVNTRKKGLYVLRPTWREILPKP